MIGNKYINNYRNTKSEDCMIRRVVNGQECTELILADAKEKVDKKYMDRSPCLAIVHIGRSTDSIDQKIDFCHHVGVMSVLLQLSVDSAGTTIVRSVIDTLDKNDEIDGIVISEGNGCRLTEDRNIGVYSDISVHKDMNRQCLTNLGGLMSGRCESSRSTVVAAIMELLEASNICLSTAGTRVLVIGQPEEEAISRQIAIACVSAGAVVTQCRCYDPCLAALAREADIVVAATDLADFIKENMVKSGVVIVDAAIDFLEGQITKEAEKMASCIITVDAIKSVSNAILIRNVVDAWTESSMIE